MAINQSTKLERDASKVLFVEKEEKRKRQSIHFKWKHFIYGQKTREKKISAKFNIE